jgi:hypothetical protein
MDLTTARLLLASAWPEVHVPTLGGPLQEAEEHIRQAEKP